MYEQLLDEAVAHGITVIEKYPFQSERIRGLCYNDTIAISEQVDTKAERTVVLCEELAHALHSTGNILHDTRAERRTRERIFDRLIGLEGLIEAFLSGCRQPWEFADFFGVPESFVEAAMQNYKQRFGTMATLLYKQQKYVLSFEPTLRVRRLYCTRSKKRMIGKESTV